MSSYPFFIPEFVLCANSSLFSFKIANEPSEFRNYLIYTFTLLVNSQYSHVCVSNTKNFPIPVSYSSRQVVITSDFCNFFNKCTLPNSFQSLYIFYIYLIKLISRNTEFYLFNSVGCRGR